MSCQRDIIEFDHMKKSTRSSSKVTFVSEKSERNIKPLIYLVMFIAMLLSATYLYIKNGGLPESGTTDSMRAVSEDSTGDAGQVSSNVVPETILEKVKKHLLVTEEDAPYVATITNIGLMREKNPDFYKYASDGDKVVVWKDRAVIYSEEKDRIIVVATAQPLLVAGKSTDSELEAASSTIASATESIEQQIAGTSIEIRNGSRVNGAARALKQSLDASGLKTEKVGDAGSVYEGTRIVDLTDGKVPAVLDLILQSTSGTVITVLPESEKSTTAQVLILIGR